MALQLFKIGSVTVGSGGSASISFTSIPQGYTDLVLKVSAQGTTSAADTDITMSINSSTANFSYRLVQGSGSAANSQNGTTNRAGFMPAATGTANTFGSGEWYFPNYTSSNNKSISVDITNERNATANSQEFNAMLWSNTAAITSITLTPSAANFAQYTIATLYGIL